MDRLRVLVAASLLAGAVALPAAPAVAAPRYDPFDCFVVTDETLLDTAVCVALASAPPEVRDPVLAVYREPLVRCVAGHSTACDHVVCAALAGLAPGVPGVVDIEPGGDTYVAGELFWDCLPYQPA